MIDHPNHPKSGINTDFHTPGCELTLPPAAEHTPGTEDHVAPTFTMLYIVGPPGVGKTAALARALRPWPAFVSRRPLLHTIYHAGRDGYFAQLGAARPGGFGGTDALPLNIAPTATKFVQARAYPVLLAEGDRLSHPAFFVAARAAGYSITILNMTAPPEVIESRRRTRGSDQNASWLRGRETKINRLLGTLCASERILQIDASRPVEYVAGDLFDQVALALAAANNPPSAHRLR